MRRFDDLLVSEETRTYIQVPVTPFRDDTLEVIATVICRWALFADRQSGCRCPALELYCTVLH